MYIPKFSVSILSAFVLSVLPFAGSTSARPYYNDKNVPETLDDVKAIQSSLHKHLERCRQATVSITDGKGSGSGVIVSKDGIVMTAAHVTAEVDKEVTVIREDGTKLKAITLGLDSFTDAALLKITEPGEYPFVEVDRKEKKFMTSKLKDWVFSLGHSGGFDKARGSVVRLGRIIRMGDKPPTFQSDCKLIGGDSGGPLFNMDGVLIGIHSRVGQVLDQNMHVASYDWFRELDDEGKELERGKGGTSKWDRMMRGEFMGNGPFAKKPVPGAAYMGIAVKEESDKLVISDVDEKGPSAKEIKKGDVLVSIDGKAMKTKAEMAAFMKEQKSGHKAKVVISRDGKEKTITVKFAKR